MKTPKVKTARWPRGRWEPVPQNARHQVKPGTTAARNCKVRVTMFLDLDVLEVFKGRAKSPSAPAYQTQINAELRRTMEQAHCSEADPVAVLRQASQLINTAAGHIQKRRPA